MHDGYLFTFGLCTTTAAASPAPNMLNHLLVMLPPVKRAAFLPDVLRIDQEPSPTTNDVLADVLDAELVLLITTSTSQGRLAPLLRLLRSQAHRKLPTCISIHFREEHNDHAFMYLDACTEAGLSLAAHLQLPPTATDFSAVRDCVRQVYRHLQETHQYSLSSTPVL